MPGFIGVINTKLSFPSETRKKLKVEKLVGERFTIERRVVDKFQQDKVFQEDDAFLVATDGVILNRTDLEAQYNCQGDFFHCVIAMYQQFGDTFFSAFRGSFSGALFDKKADKWLVFTDHIGDKQVFYTYLPQGFLFGSEIGFLVDTLKLNNLPVTINKIGAYLALTQGFVIEDKTLVTEVHKLIAGNYICVDKRGVRVLRYHRFSNKPRANMTVEEAVNGIDYFFRRAVKLQFKKDREYGYRHLTCLSGGLDSRMTVWVAHEMGYTDQLNTTFSQSGYLDFSIAQQIAIDLHHDFLFKPLDHGDFLTDIDNITRITYGSTCYFGLAHGLSLYNLINYEPFGLIHTGMIGDAIIGTFFKKNVVNTEFKLGQGAYSQELLERLSDYHFVEDYENEEIFCLYTRAFTGANQGMVGFQEDTESCSPFCDVDFINFCYSIPLNLRYHHKIYFDWILQKYPIAAEYVWEKTRRKIHHFENVPPKTMRVFGFEVPAFSDPSFPQYLKGFMLRRLGILKRGQKPKTITIDSADNMNPVDYWYNNNPDLRKRLNDYWASHIDIVTDEQLKADLNHLFYDCVVYDKLQALSVLSAIKMIHS